MFGLKPAILERPTGRGRSGIVAILASLPSGNALRRGRPLGGKPSSTVFCPLIVHLATAKDAG